MRNPRAALAAIGIAVAFGAAPMAQQADAAKTAPGQAKKAVGTHDVANAKVKVHASGAISAELDESFEDAVVVKINPDGTRTYTCLHGLPLAAGHLTAKKPKAAAPALEEK